MFVKFEPGEFLEKAELERFRKSLDENGFRQFLLDNTLKFGLVDRQYFNESNVVQNTFENAMVFETAGLTIAHKEIEAINKDGLTIFKKETTNISVPADSNWYWVKIKHQYTSRELGIFSIDDQGNLVGDTDSELLTILRGQPYFPSKVRFLNAVNNTLEYDVLEVVNDQNAVLQGFFQAESGLELSVVGTFAPDVTPTAAQKDIFQYDGCELSLVQETSVNVAPTKLVGEEFYLARVKNDGVAIVIQDKRIEIWRTRANFYLHNVDKAVNNLLGVENVRFDHPNATRDYNPIDIAWGFKSENWSVDTKLNQVTLSGGLGGRYRDVSYVNTGDFDGWLLYWGDGSFSNILSSTQNGSQINLVLDVLDIDKVSSDGGVTINAGTLLTVPNAEEIEIELNPWAVGEPVVAPPGQINQPPVTKQIYVFPIAEQRGICRALAYDTTVQFSVRYRYRKNNEYSPWMNMLADTQHGYFTEKAFDDNGYLLGVVATQTYSANVLGGYIRTYPSYQVHLQLKDDAYINQITSIDLGDLLGVETVAITTTPNDINLVVGVSRQYQYISGAQFTLNDSKRIVLGNGLRNGNFFIIHFKQNFILNSNTLKITDAAFSTLRDITQRDIDFLSNSREGIFIQCTWDGTTWILNSINETNALNPTIQTTWLFSTTGQFPAVYLNDFSGNHNGVVPFSYAATNYDRVLNFTTDAVSPTWDLYVYIESGVASNIFNPVARAVRYGGGQVHIAANCRFRITVSNVSIGAGSADFNIQKNGL